MPSSLIFTGLVVLWLLILVPAIAGHQQEVARPSGAALAGRVLARPRRRFDGYSSDEGDSVDDEGTRTVGARTAEVWVPAARAAGGATAAVRTGAARPADGPAEEPDAEPGADTAPAGPDDDADGTGWERPAPRYRPGRGGFDAEADAENARRRYAVRQRIVLTLLVLALITGVAAAVVLPVLWWVHGAVDLILVSYLVHLRRQVREEARIRERRAARMAGTRRPPAAEDRDLDAWARRGRDLTRRPSSSAVEEGTGSDATGDPAELEAELGEGLTEDGDADRVRGVGAPVGLLPARRRGADDDTAEPPSALPPLKPAPPPPLPPGTSLVEADDDDLDLHDLDTPVVRGAHRRAVGR
ncbi:MAG TPA: gephyrin-like molybdotransferase receptor GlpR [Pseudonocardia sp.]